MKHVQHTAAHPPLCHAHASWVPARSPAMLTRHPDQQCAAGQACISNHGVSSRHLAWAQLAYTLMKNAGLSWQGSGTEAWPRGRRRNQIHHTEVRRLGALLRAHDAPPAAAAASSSFCRFSMPCRQAQSSGTARELGAAATHERQKQRVSGELGIAPQACEGRRHRALVQPAPTPSPLPCLP